MSEQFDRLVDIVKRLRAPNGCPWDREQTHESLLSGLLEEVYEFFEAVAGHDTHGMKEELGDILLQVAFHAQLAREDGRFDVDGVARGICEKLIRRHPHVFDSATVTSTADVLKNWEAIKRSEKGNDRRTGVTDGIPHALPALLRAEKVQRRVARSGFDWNTIGPVLDKVEEEFAEFRSAVEKGDDRNAAEELGDILFALVNLARHRGVCAEDALRATVRKFERRFRFIEDRLREQGKTPDDASLEEMDIIWEESKGADNKS